MGFGSFDDVEFIWIALKLFGLEIVFSGGVDDTILLEFSGVEVGEEPVWFIFSVKLDRALIFLIHVNKDVSC